MAESYRRLERSGFIKDGKAQRVELCGGYLKFRECTNPNHPKRLVLGYFCQVRLCPMCAWRRSRMIFAQLMQIIHEAKKEQKLEFITLTLTAKNVGRSEIKEELDRYFKAWNRLAQRKPFKDAVLGWFRALEIKHDMEKDEYHPHFHCLFAVKPSYFRKDQAPRFISQEEWADMWQQSMRLDYTPIVWVEKVKAKRGRKKKVDPIDPEKAMEQAISEVAKYFSKSEDYINEDDELGTDMAVYTLDDAIRGRRLVAYGGIFKDIRRKLKQEDVEKADLIKLREDNEEEVDCTCSVCKSQLQEVIYRWNVGLSQYVAEPVEQEGE